MVTAIVKLLVVSEINIVDPWFHHGDTDGLDVFAMSWASSTSKGLDLIIEPLVDAIFDDNFDAGKIDSLCRMSEYE